LDSQVKRLVRVDDHLLHFKPIPQFESRRQRLSLLGMAAGFARIKTAASLGVDNPRRWTSASMSAGAPPDRLAARQLQ
jgi:hypothetical protein